MDLYEELAALAVALEANQIEYAVCGGVALAIHGLPRFTKDIDILIQSEDLPRLEAIAAERGFLDSSGRIVFEAGTPQEQVVYRYVKCVGSDYLMLDLLTATPIFLDPWRERETLEWGNRRIQVVSRRGLGIMKRLAGRPQDLVDLSRLGFTAQDENDTEKASDGPP